MPLWAVVLINTQYLPTAYELLVEEKPLAEVVVKETAGGYHLVAANSDVTAAEVRLLRCLCP